MKARLRTRWGHPQSCANAHDSSLCGGSLWGGASCKASPERGGARHWRAKGFVPPTLAGRGGSVSRRDLNPAYWRHAHLSGGTKPKETRTPNASRSSGGSAREGLLSEKPPPSHYSVSFILRKRGSGGEALLLEKRPLPQNLPQKMSFPEGARGRGLFFRKGPSLAFIHTSFLLY